MKIRIEQAKPVVSQSGRSYFSFWVRVLDGVFAVGIGGWKYFPDTNTISSPSMLKGQTKGTGARRFMNTTQPNPAFFNEVLQQAIQYFEGETITTPEPEIEEVKA